MKRSLLRHGEAYRLSCNHEKADTRLCLHAQDSIKNGFNRAVGVCQDTDVVLLLLHYFGTSDAEVFMESGLQQGVLNTYNSTGVALPAMVLQNLPAFHGL